MSPARQRKTAAKALGIAIQQRLENLYEASSSGDETAITVATVDMAQVMYDNAEFIVWALKTLGGLNPPPPERIKPIPMQRPAPPKPANDLPVISPAITGNSHANECTCPPMEPGIIGYKHMASCPQFEPV